MREVQEMEEIKSLLLLNPVPKMSSIMAATREAQEM
jgi:hypothetical protein